MKALAAATLLALLCAAESARIMDGYFVNWAQYRPAPYTYMPTGLAPIVGKINHLMYSFLYFDENFSVYTVEPKDVQFIQEIMNYRQSNPNLKVLISVGGWNFPSANFSRMVSTEENRKAFISSLNDFMKQHGFDGVDIDWEYPCSAPRTDYVKITCTDIKVSKDAGGHCPDDTNNYLQLAKELKSAMGEGKLLTIASPAAERNWMNVALKEMSTYVDYWHVMTYDYSVPDIKDANVTAPNAPLYTPDSPGVVQWSINYTITGYLKAGVPPSKILVGFPLYGHTWYVPGMADSDKWKQFGVKASIQGQCCGPFAETYGAKYGKGSQQCGVYMYSEMVAAGVTYYFDEHTKSAIGYMEKDSADAWTKAGTWFTYSDKNSIDALVKYIDSLNLAGAFVFDTSDDSVNYATHEFTYELTNYLYNGLQN